MGWLSKLPRIIRPPKNVRKELEKIKGSDFLPTPIKTIGGILSNAGQTINTVKQQAQQASQDVATAKKNSDIIMYVVIGIGIVLLFFLMRRR